MDWWKMGHLTDSLNLDVVTKVELIRATSHMGQKSHDHEIVRAQKKVSKCRRNTVNTPSKSCSVVTDPQVQCEVNM